MDATLVAGWEALCQALSPAFTRPTFVTFVHIAAGWVLCRSRPTVTNLVCTIGASLLGHAAKHWTTYERFFYRAAWSLAAVSRRLLVQVVAPLVRSYGVERVIDLAIDDTTCARCGRHVAFAGSFKDASAGNALKTVVHWAHNWVIGCVTMRPKRWPYWVLGLPVWFALYRKPGACDKRHPFRTRQQIAADMIRQTRQALPDWTIRVAADGQYATTQVVEATGLCGTSLVSRLRRDAALYALPPQRRRAQRGRKPKKGRRLATPRQMAARRRKGWRTVEAWVYGQALKRRILSVVCLWYHVSRDRPIKVLIVRDPQGRQDDDFVFCTDPTADDVEIIERFAARWPIEEVIRDGKQSGGFEQVQGWCPRTVERQAPLAMIVQTLVKAWYLRYGVHAPAAQPRGADWSQCKTHPSYLDMLATLRGVLWTQRITMLWTHRINIKSPLSQRVRDLWNTLHFTLCAAA